MTAIYHFGIFTGMDKPFKARPLRDLLESREEQEKREARIGRQVKEAREAAGLTQSGLAAMAGVTTPYLNRIEKGHKRPSTGMLRNLLDVLEGKEGDTGGEDKDRP